MEDPSLGLHFKDLLLNLSALVRSEVQLAALETQQGASRVVRRGLHAAIYVGIAYLGVVSLLAAAVIGLGDLFDGDYALSASLIGLVLAIPCSILTYKILKHERNSP